MQNRATEWPVRLTSPLRFSGWWISALAHHALLKKRVETEEQQMGKKRKLGYVGPSVLRFVFSPCLPVVDNTIGYIISYGKSERPSGTMTNQ